jgi:hypothetical protein
LRSYASMTGGLVGALLGLTGCFNVLCRLWRVK